MADKDDDPGTVLEAEMPTERDINPYSRPELGMDFPGYKDGDFKPKYDPQISLEDYRPSGVGAMCDLYKPRDPLRWVHKFEHGGMVACVEPHNQQILDIFL